MLEPALRAVPIALAGGVVAALVATGVEDVLGKGFIATLIAVVVASAAFGGAVLAAGGALSPLRHAPDLRTITLTASTSNAKSSAPNAMRRCDIDRRDCVIHIGSGGDCTLRHRVKDGVPEDDADHDNPMPMPTKASPNP